MTATRNLHRLRDFVMQFGVLADESRDEAHILEAGAPLLRQLVAHDDWLPDAWAEPGPDHYRQYLLHCDSRERFSVVSFVWGPGQSTPRHNHRTWGLIGMLRGGETSEPWAFAPDGRFSPRAVAKLLAPGDVEAISVAAGDIHRVANAFSDQVSISIHVYGANIGRVERAIYDEQGHIKPFVSGYFNDACPNIWDKD